VERNDLVVAIARFSKRAAVSSAPVSPAIAKHRPAFLENRRLDLEKMRVALAAGDFASIQVIGHNCKGTGVGYGFPEITAFGSAIEQAAKASSSSVLEKAFDDFEECIGAAALSC
jgi:HPt (histidine-containing phosphotransfer) domain-containing protein